VNSTLLDLNVVQVPPALDMQIATRPSTTWTNSHPNAPLTASPYTGWPAPRRPTLDPKFV
jgi:hypothetical protein